MKPREKLIKESSVIIREAFQRGFDSESVSELDNFDGFIEAEEILNQYAIGRWVPVEERLPELGGDGRFSGLIYMSDDRTAAGLFDWELCKGVITHWLDLSLPSGKGEA